MNLTEDEQREQYRHLRCLGAFGPENCVPYISEEGFLQAQEAFARQQERKHWSGPLLAAMEVAERAGVVVVLSRLQKTVYVQPAEKIATGRIDLDGLSAGAQQLVMDYLRQHLTPL